ncbi:type VI secretion system protein TssA [Rubrivivax gelatinosus]|nr:type VI secretion system protein TssA [Rubrivivax gelatinosus]
MPASDFELEPLLAPLGDEAPCGPDLVYDDAFAALERAAAGRPETQWSAAVPPDWADVQSRALALAGRSRDLRTAVWLTRARTRLSGIEGLADGLALVAGLVERHWADVHPQLDAADGHDSTMRMNTLAALAARDAGLADLDACPLVPVRGSLGLRELELGLGRAEPGAGETAPTEAGVLAALQGLLARHGRLAAAAQEALRSVNAVDARLQALDAAKAPDLGPLRTRLQTLCAALARLPGAAAGAAPAAPDAPTVAAGAPATIRDRGDAARELGRICDWIEHNEPSNPAPLLIRRAQRLMSKSFLEIVRDLAPDGLAQVERIAGTET